MTQQKQPRLVDWITSSEAAELIGVSSSTLSRWRTNFEDGEPLYGPTFRKNPGAKNAHVKYSRAVVMKWIADNEVASRSA